MDRPRAALRKTFWLEDEPTAAFDAGCTGSVFLADGARVFGPSPRGMDRLESRIEGDYVNVEPGTVLIGACSSGVTPRRDCSTPDKPVTQRYDQWLASR